MTHLPTDQKADRLALHDICNAQSCIASKDKFNDCKSGSEISAATRLTSQSSRCELQDSSAVLVPKVAYDSTKNPSKKCNQSPAILDKHCRDNSQSVGFSKSIQICDPICEKVPFSHISKLE